MGELEFHFCIGGARGRPSHPYIESATALSDTLSPPEHSGCLISRISIGGNSLYFMQHLYFA